jgi:N-acetylglucosaminyldiphosphoundecaprenol N-acetyl-beta-D-mannosaminyltransferase
MTKLATDKPDSFAVLGVPVGILTMAGAIEQVNTWISKGTGRPRLVTFTNIHMITEAQLRPGFLEVLQNMDVNCPDGAPIFWMARKKFGRRAAKISGPDFMPQFCEQSAGLGHRHFLYGGAPGVAEASAQALRESYPGINIVGCYTPPFRKLAQSEIEETAEMINATNPDAVWVCLGCPKQELWMHEMQDMLNAKVMLAVGQAFDILAKRTQRAPHMLVSIGFEWAYRLFQEPRRLWKRYLVMNVLFACLMLREKLGYKEQWSVLNKPSKIAE